MPSGTQSFTYDCGTKSLQLVMAYYGVEVPYYKLLRKINCHKRYGLPGNKMANIARGYGFKVKSESNCSLGKIKRHISKKEPVIILIQAWAENNLTELEWEETEDYGHYSIVIGIDEGKVYFNDPLSFNKTWLTEQEFLNRWHGDGNKKFALFISGRNPCNGMEHMD
ncbi:MAG: cysteine peptidase family C39 domain-containing protein [Patescibacteria group bacterium]|jgi:ABC-type bacteriocin/lantibiotic exporter with double-glycine peptidase domain